MIERLSHESAEREQRMMDALEEQARRFERLLAASSAPTTMPAAQSRREWKGERAADDNEEEEEEAAAATQTHARGREQELQQQQQKQQLQRKADAHAAAAAERRCAEERAVAMEARAAATAAAVAKDEGEQLQQLRTDELVAAERLRASERAEAEAVAAKAQQVAEAHRVAEAAADAINEAAARADAAAQRQEDLALQAEQAHRRAEEERLALSRAAEEDALVAARLQAKREKEALQSEVERLQKQVASAKAAATEEHESADAAVSEMKNVLRAQTKQHSLALALAVSASRASDVAALPLPTPMNSLDAASTASGGSSAATAAALPPRVHISRNGSIQIDRIDDDHVAALVRGAAEIPPQPRLEEFTAALGRRPSAERNSVAFSGAAFATPAAAAATARSVHASNDAEERALQWNSLAVKIPTGAAFELPIDVRGPSALRWEFHTRSGRDILFTLRLEAPSLSSHGAPEMPRMLSGAALRERREREAEDELVEEPLAIVRNMSKGDVMLHRACRLIVSWSNEESWWFGRELTCVRAGTMASVAKRTTIV